MQLYELNYLLKPELTKEERASVQEKIKSFIQQEKSSLIHSIPPSKRELAYPIKKKKEAFLATLIFKLNPKDLSKIKKKIKSEKEIIRYLVFKKKEELKKEKKVSPKKEIKQKPKVELKEIEKKLEEILGE